jgi:vacuolar-type H+-ATPase subunit I/STV1
MNAVTRAVLAAVLLIVPVATEAFVGADNLGVGGHALFVVTQLAGWGLLLSLSQLLAARAGGSRWAARLVQAGCVLQLVFAAGYGITALVWGEPSEGMFVAFLLGFLALTVGGVAWGAQLLRAGGAASAGTGLLAVAVLGLLAMAVGVDPFHDIFLLSSYAAWVAVGGGIERVDQPEQVLVSDASR